MLDISVLLKKTTKLNSQLFFLVLSKRDSLKMNLAAGSGTGSFASLRDGEMGLGSRVTGGGDRRDCWALWEASLPVGQAGNPANQPPKWQTSAPPRGTIPTLKGRPTPLSHRCHLLKMQPPGMENWQEKTAVHQGLQGTPWG